MRLYTQHLEIFQCRLYLVKLWQDLRTLPCYPTKNGSGIIRKEQPANIGYEKIMKNTYLPCWWRLLMITLHQKVQCKSLKNVYNFNLRY